jgi:Lytic transglycolase
LISSGTFRISTKLSIAMNKPAWIALTAVGITVALQPMTMATTVPPSGPVITELSVVELPTQTAVENPPTVETLAPIAEPPVVTFTPANTEPSWQLGKEFVGSFKNYADEQSSSPAQPLEIPAYLPEPSRILGHSGNKENRPAKTSDLGPLDSPEPIEIPAVSPTAPTSGGNILQTQSGQASWYGYEAGNMTASGERYNSQDLTAAHRTLAFGSRVRVTNIRNGKSVVVRINDRGPFIRGRVIDLSEAAAAAVGIKSSGVGNVQLDILSYGSKGRSRR